MIQKIKQFLIFILSPIWLYYKYLNLSNVLVIKKISKDGVFLHERPIGEEQLFVLKLTTDYDFFKTLDLNAIKKTQKYEKNAQFNYFFVKQGLYEMGYIATFSKQLALEFKDKLNLKICGTADTIRFLFDMYSINKYQANLNDFTITPSVNLNSLDKDSLLDPFYHNLNRIFTDSSHIQNKEYNLYQVVQVSPKNNIPYKEVFDKNFNGLLSFYVDLSSKGLDFIINDFLAYTKKADGRLTPDAMKLVDANKESRLNCAVVNAILLTNNEVEAQKTSAKLGLQIVKKDSFDKLYIQKKTFLQTREIDYDIPLPLDVLSNLIGVRTKNNLTREKVKSLEKEWTDIEIDFYGYNIYGSLVNFCFRANENPHAVIIADAGSGKSVSIQKILSSIYRIDFEKEVVKRWDKVKTRYFEIGNSSAILQNFFKRLYGDDVGLIEGSLESMKFSVCDIKTTKNKYGEDIVESDSLSISIALMNVILVENGESPLTASEQVFYEDAVKKVYKSQDRKNLTIKKLKDISYRAYKDKIDLFEAKGYDETTYLSEITDCGNLDSLKKPMLRDIINTLNKDSESTNVNGVEKEVFASLLVKLNAISRVENSLFGSLNSVELNNKPFYCIEFNNIKKNKSLLRSIFCLLFVSIYEADVADALERKNNGLKMKQTIFLFEELRNFVEDNPEIEKLLKVLVFEGRKYQIHGLFIAQKVAHVPPQLLQGCSSFFFLMPPKDEQKVDLKKSVMELYETEAVKFLLDNIEPHTLGIISSQGSFSCKLDLTEKELKMFAV